MFLNDRTTAVWLDEEISDKESIKIGVQQELPAAPIFFMLFIAPLFKILTKEEKKARIKIRSFVDNSFLTAKTFKEVTSTAKIQDTFAQIGA